ncbi:MAG: tRNA (N6-isopentenyl adenosine(37)-C2)-methylthiotransferase MiaB [Clostridia bacterium]|nr:tRNA (N6-isopentenyl adenosine(37)-C2)-methylthiotransferase MiaB [Clostridia bacterium]
MSFGHCDNAVLTEQLTFAKRVKDRLYKSFGHIPLACVITFGCQQNVSDSEHLKGLLCEMGYSLTDDTEKADFIIFNTCAVREHAEDRVYGNIGRVKQLKKDNPALIAAVCGCMAQQETVAEKIKKSYPYIDIVFGTQVSHRLPEFIYKRLCGSPRIFELKQDNGDIIENVPVKRDGKLKGWLPIMYGCNNFCTYCIVPYVRGRERSRDPEKILEEARAMVAAGYKDITLLGQNVNSYGKGCTHGVTFAELLRRINDIEGEFRIRFMTSHPKDCTVELLDTIRDCKKISRHLHLPFQSGSDRILKLMNRHYDRKGYLELIKASKERIPDLALTSDIIVGFPGETYEDFKETLSLVEQVRFTSLFTFIYSPRGGTPAAIMEDPVSRKEKGEWFDELLRLQEGIASENIKALLGKTFRVLCDDFGSAEGLMSGHTAGTAVVEFEGDSSLLGEFLDVEITSYENVFKGKIIN